jgi:hypothetical protein
MNIFSFDRDLYDNGGSTETVFSTYLSIEVQKKRCYIELDPKNQCVIFII